MRHYIIPFTLTIIIVFFLYVYNKSIVYEPFAHGDKILVIYTGGTIGMTKTSNGYAPKTGYLEKQLTSYQGLYGSGSDKEQLPLYDVLEYDPLIDSSNMTIAMWNKMTRTIADNYNKYSAFIILHGTDTMAYTASALSFSLENLSKPVVVTGSQMSISEIKNDAYNNILTAFEYIQKTKNTDVVLAFDNSIMLGNRSKKISSTKYHAFSSPNYLPVGEFGINFEETNLVKHANTSATFTPSYFDNNINIPIIFISPSKKFIVPSGITALILMTYGVGNGPTDNSDFIAMLTQLKNSNINVYNISQTMGGRIDEGDYATGNALKEHGVIGGADMTIEAAYAKLIYLHSKYDAATCAKLFKQNLRGELS
jgi:L-asparaginase